MDEASAAFLSAKARCLLNNPLYIPPVRTESENSVSTESSTVIERIEDACAGAVDDVSILCPQEVARGVASTLNKALDEKTIRSYSYNPGTKRLSIHTMARPIHDAVLPWIDDFLVNSRSNGFLSLEESFLVRQFPASARIPRYREGRPWTKYSDGSFSYGPLGSDLKPTVIFEVWFSETQSALIDDAEHWFIGTKGSVQLVVLINIIEDTKALARHKTTPECQNRLENLARKFANETALSDMAIENEYADEDSNPEMYDSMEKELEIDDFVGPIEAFLEVYEFNGEHPVRRGPVHPIIPQGTQEDYPSIYISDVLPRSHVNARDKRETFLDLERYRKCLTASFQKFALFRALDMLRPGPKVYEWQNY